MARIVDLRSDTVTRPTDAMRKAMAEAEVGDDVYGEDPTAQRLQELAAEVTGKESALFVPSGTMSNQVALLCHTRPGDEVLIGQGAHCSFYESGAGAAIAGVQFLEIGAGGLFRADQLEPHIKPDAYYLPRTRLVVLENTHNRAGGQVFPQDDVVRICALAKSRGLARHLDGARVWNAAVATGKTVAELCAPFDTVSVCFSKGLGAPCGSALAGPEPMIRAAVRFRKMLGGGMRQVGVLAAGALYALRHHRERLAEDHEHARRLATALADAPRLSPQTPETNIVNIDVPGLSAERVVAAAARRGVLLNASGPERLRAVTHLDVTQNDMHDAARALTEAANEIALP